MASADTTPKPMIGAMFRGPGPCYALPGTTGYVNHDVTKKKAPGYIFGIKQKDSDKHKSPGPAKYNINDKVTRFGKDGSPQYTIHYRPNELSKFKTPGPDVYRTETSKFLKEQTAPSYSFGGRTRYSQRQHTPAPNAYSLPLMIGTRGALKPSTPSYSMSARIRRGGFNEDLKKTPGPGTYKSADLNSFKKRSPQFSMGGRYLMPGDSTQKPGPAEYLPSITKGQTPKFSFGLRHSEFEAPLITEVE